MARRWLSLIGGVVARRFRSSGAVDLPVEGHDVPGLAVDCDTRVERRGSEGGFADDSMLVRRAELEALTSQARWLLEYHGRRTDSTYQRGTAVLAANGVLLGLIATAVRTQTGSFTTTEQISLLLAVWLVLASATFALAAIAPRKTGAPNVHDLQVFYGARYGAHAGRLHDDVLSTLLGTAQGAEPHENPVAEAAREAGRRIRWFKWSVRWLAAALASLVAFVVYTVLIR